MKFAGYRLRLALSALSALLAAAAGTASLAQDTRPDGTKPASLPGVVAGGKSFKKPYGAHLEPILKVIEATPDQRKKITDVMAGYRPKIQPLREQYNHKRDEFLKSLCDGKEAEVIMSQQVELGHLYSDIISQYTCMRLEIRRFLTPKQILLFEQYRKQQGWSR